MTIYYFLEQCKELVRSNNDLPCFEYEEFKHVNRINCPPLFIFKSEEELLEVISQNIADYYYKNERLLEDIPSFSSTQYDVCGYNIAHVFFQHVDLLKAGINMFALYGEDDIMVIHYDRIPSYERMIIDNYIWSRCDEIVLNKLSKLTAFKLYLETIENVPGRYISTYEEFGQINTVNQLRMFIEYKEADKLFLLNDSFGTSIEINNKILNLPIDSLPSFITMDAILEKTWCRADSCYQEDDNYIIDYLRFLIIPNIDKSITLKPHPADIELLISKQLELWNENLHFIYDDEMFNTELLIFPEPLKPLMNYYYKNKIESPYGFIDRIISFLEYDNLAKEKEYLDYQEYVMLCEQAKERGEMLTWGFIPSYSNNLIINTFKGSEYCIILFEEDK